MEYYSAIKKQGKPTICNNMDDIWRHYTEWISQRHTNNIWFHLYVESKNKNTKLIEKRNLIYCYWRESMGAELEEGDQKF